MNSSFDLIIFKQEKRLSAAPISVSFSQKICVEQAAHFRGTDYSGLEAFGDWLAVCDANRKLVGLQIMIYEQLDIVNSSFFKSKNVSKEGEDFRVLFIQTASPQLDGWPFSTVYSLKSRSNDYIIYIPNFYSDKQTVPLAKDFILESVTDDGQ